MQRGIVILKTSRGWLLYRNPVREVRAERPEEVLLSLADIQRAEEDGLHAAGFIAYEAAPAFDPALKVRAAGRFPLLWFGLYGEREEVSELPPGGGAFALGEWRPSITKKSYDAAVGSIRELIAAGDSYQVNFTLRLRARFEGDPWALFRERIAPLKMPFSAFLHTSDGAILSASPELFFRLQGDRLETRPMKGTAPRGRWSGEDERLAHELGASPKNRAENLMIVDLLRNDLSRVARPASVRTESLFDVERYGTLHQMTSTISCRTDAPLPEILRALFPCGSVTGAPKVRTMEIIAELESAPRRIYTGAIGYLSPGREARFNVAIRTLLLYAASGRAEYGVGGGITWDSNAQDEYEECLLKAKILVGAPPPFDLLETLLYESGKGYRLLDRHLKRLAASAAYFGFRVDDGTVRREFEKRAASLGAGRHKVRLLLSKEGTLKIEIERLPEEDSGKKVRLGLAREPVSSADPFLYHKTTNRSVYERARASRPDCDDVLLLNERGELTESSISNLVVEKDGKLLTPPLESGLLPGTFREELLEKGKIREAVLYPEDLGKASRVYLVNSVRGWIDGEWIGERHA